MNLSDKRSLRRRHLTSFACLCALGGLSLATSSTQDSCGYASQAGLEVDLSAGHANIEVNSDRDGLTLTFHPAVTVSLAGDELPPSWSYEDGSVLLSDCEGSFGPDPADVAVGGSGGAGGASAGAPAKDSCTVRLLGMGKLDLLITSPSDVQSVFVEARVDDCQGSTVTLSEAAP